MKINKIILLIPALFLVLLIRILKPFVIVRLYGLDAGRIGGAIVVDYYIAECLAGMHSEARYYDIFYLTTSTGKIANKTWLNMIGRTVTIFKFMALGQLVYKINKRFKGWEQHVIPIQDPVPSFGEIYTGRKTSKALIGGNNGES